LQKEKASIKIYSPIIKNDKYAFDSAIENVEMFYTIKSIKGSAFFNCSSLKNVLFSKNISEIGNYAFSNCCSLKSITLPDSITKLGSGVFKGCTALKTISLPTNTKKLPREFFENCRELECVSLPNGLEAIGEECFSGCVNLKEVTLPDTLKYIGAKAFKRCSSLKTLIMPKSLEFIGDKAFEGCTSLTNVVFNSMLDYVGKAAFPECAYTLPTINGTMFSTSFIPKPDYSLCPVVKIPKEVKTLYLGFENTLDYNHRCDNKTCYCHILSLEKHSAKVFIGESYYSYDEKDALMKNGCFDFEKYDSQFAKSEGNEKAIISAFRLTYPIELKKETEIKYKRYLTETVEYAALFATEKNEEDVLKFITDNYELSTDYCTFLYEKASKNGYLNLLQILSQIKQNNGFSEIDHLFKEVLG